LKGKAATVVGVLTPNFLSATMLDRLPGPREEIRPADSLSSVGDKRRYELMEQELAHFYDEHNKSEDQPSERARHEHPEKRPKAREA
jgi:hypothetical protein